MLAYQHAHYYRTEDKVKGVEKRPTIARRALRYKNWLLPDRVLDRARPATRSRTDQAETADHHRPCCGFGDSDRLEVGADALRSRSAKVHVHVVDGAIEGIAPTGAHADLDAEDLRIGAELVRVREGNAARPVGERDAVLLDRIAGRERAHPEVRVLKVIGNPGVLLDTGADRRPVIDRLVDQVTGLAGRLVAEAETERRREMAGGRARRADEIVVAELGALVVDQVAERAVERMGEVRLVLTVHDRVRSELQRARLACRLIGAGDGDGGVRTHVCGNPPVRIARRGDVLGVGRIECGRHCECDETICESVKELHVSSLLPLTNSTEPRSFLAEVSWLRSM
jgi:hypothetical protein